MRFVCGAAILFAAITWSEPAHGQAKKDKAINSLNDALEVAKSQNKLVLVSFENPN